MKLKDVISPFYVWQRAFEKPYTNTKPIDTRPGADAYRGFHVNDIDKCVGCSSCQTICQNHAIDMVTTDKNSMPGDSGLRPRFDYGRCCWCALCVDICPSGSLHMSNEYAWVSDDPDSFRFTPGVDEKPWYQHEQGYHRDPNYNLLKLERAEMDMLSTEEGLKSFDEVVSGYNHEQAIAEADRCIECNICIATCPAHMDIPDYIKAIREQDLEEGLRILYKTNPFSATCGRICTHRCEDDCTISHLGKPLAIRWLKRYIIDQIPAENFARILQDSCEENGKKVAIVGAGPGGMSAAYYLRKQGYRVSVYEANKRAGGMLRYGVPTYRLPDDQLDKDIDYIISLGVTMHYETKVGIDIEFNTILDNNDAVFLSTGLNVPSNLRITGEEHPRVVSGLQVLFDTASGNNPNVGQKVAVIGGGNVAMDAARVSRRFGADVTVLYRRRLEDMPADPEEIKEATEEHCHFVTQAIPVKIVPADNPNQAIIHWGEAEMVDDGKGGRPRPILQDDKMHTETYDTIISAIGQSGDYSFLSESIRNDLSLKWHKFEVDDRQRTRIGNIFIGGDVANEVADAVSAIADGHNAAIGIHQYISEKV
ncbi:MAG: FAD-dependent oxidoreductase [Methylococcales bacterium]|jgi:glutamate synthase (NADPH) small chain|nr:FAD-dependent oxidoreductase [Methylococcales bacterium]MBT7445012.1 FAD-dependent oxidoreductase [Methylococcales bacterium]